MVTNSKTILLAASLLFLSSCEDGGVSGLVEGGGGGCSPCKIFITAATSNGNLGGVTGADAKCASDANNPGDGTYKAWVGVSGQRVGTAGSQINWIIKPSTAYTRTDGTIIAYSTADGTLPDALTNTISTTLLNVHTGIQGNGTLTGSDCLGWTSALITEYGTVGVTNYQTDGGYVNFSNTTCNITTRRLYCVEQ